MRKTAILGLGRSGLALAKACQSEGGSVTVFDAKPRSDRRLAGFAAALDELGLPLVDEFRGDIPAGFDLLITSPGVDSRSAVLQNAAAAGVEVIGEIEYAYRISSAPIIAITGTNGKSTTTAMTYCVLQACGAKPVLCGNIYGSGYDEIPLTEAALASQPDQVLVAEISSFQLEWVKEFRPKCAAITNITPDHLNRYDSFEHYAQAKRRIFGRMGQGDTIAAHALDPQTFPPARSLATVKQYGPSGPDVIIAESGLALGSAQIAVSELPFWESHNLRNAACAVLLAQGVMPQALEDQLLEGLKQFRPLAHRMEPVGEGRGIRFINNSMCTNPAAVVASSESLPAHQHLLVGGIKKNYDFAPLRDHLKVTGHRVYLFGRDGAEIAAELQGNLPVFGTLKEAFSSAIASAAAGDVIMLAPGCASMDQYDDFVARGEEFRALAKEWLNNGTKS